MNKRFFWQMPERIKFRTVFEDAETVVGVNKRNQHHLFRKDTNVITFNQHEALETFLIKMIEKNWKAITRKRGKRLRTVCT